MSLIALSLSLNVHVNICWTKPDFKSTLETVSMRELLKENIGDDHNLMTPKQQVINVFIGNKTLGYIKCEQILEVRSNQESLIANDPLDVALNNTSLFLSLSKQSSLSQFEDEDFDMDMHIPISTESLVTTKDNELNMININHNNNNSAKTTNAFNTITHSDVVKVPQAVHQVPKSMNVLNQKHETIATLNSNLLTFPYYRKLLEINSMSHFID